MRYRGYDILPEYASGADFKLRKTDDKIIPRRPKPEDILYYTIVHRKSKWTAIPEFTIPEAKAMVDKLYLIEEGLLGLK